MIIDPKYSIGIEKMDAQHARWIQLIDEFRAAASGHLLERAGIMAARRALDELLKYTRSHFASEEEFIAAHHYPDLEAHKQKHRELESVVVKLQDETGMGLVLITHSMGVVAETADRVSVQYAGQKVEEQKVEDLFRDPHHPYTAALLSALPERAAGRQLPSIPGVVPGQFDRPSGCLFSPRCPLSTERCRTTKPPRIDGALCHYALRDGVPRNHPQAKEQAA